MTPHPTNRLEPSAPSEDQVDENHPENKAKTAATVVAKTWAHIVAAAAEEQNQENQNDDKRHARKCIMQRSPAI